ncbi:response regulator transcription factor [Dyella dinghuensis]|uniref:Response regulator transcription factor n=1 Tax=Dyella dinghuensis TaxID=1920169 RepID=A0A432LYN8_9GAMM|nr:response regulator transcription factor [Dyella dinghuensis]RUL66759.1 response regulator transcription factor [Dyella dinghuensis]
MTIRVAVADDHPTLLAGMEHLLTGLNGISLIGAVTSSTDLVALLTGSACDVVVTDFSMPGGRYGDGLSLLRFLKRRFPATRLVVLTGIENDAVMQGIRDLGAVGIVSKSDDLQHLESAIGTAFAGGSYVSPRVAQILERAVSDADTANPSPQLSKRETEVLRLYAEGLSVSEIGARAGRSSKTISAQKMAAMKKLGLQRDADVFKYAVAHGLVSASQTSRQKARQSDEDVSND